MTGKLDRLMEIEGYGDVVDLFAAVLADSVSPGICINPGCDYLPFARPTHPCVSDRKQKSGQCRTGGKYRQLKVP